MKYIIAIFALTVFLLPSCATEDENAQEVWENVEAQTVDKTLATEDDDDVTEH